MASHVCESDPLSSAASILLYMSHEGTPQPDGDTSDEQHNVSDGASASRKGQPWSEDEHLAFLRGLRALGKGNWRAIARQYIPTRTATQVASHAQKHFMRKAGATKRKSRFTALELEVAALPKPGQAVEAVQLGQANQARQKQSSLPVQPLTSFAALSTPLPAFEAFPFMSPMMFGFPGSFFAPFLCMPPAFAAAAASIFQKQGHMPPFVLPPMFPMAATMAAVNPVFMAQQMAAAAHADRAPAGNAVTSGTGTIVGSGPAATTDTAISDEVPRRTQSALACSPSICKPEAQHARPASVAPVVAATAAVGAPVECGVDGNVLLAGATSGAHPEHEGAVLGRSQLATSVGGRLTGQVALTPVGPRLDDATPLFQTSTHSAFRPPHEVKTET